MGITYGVTIVLASAALCWLIIALRLRFVGSSGIDLPNARSLHSMPTPHGGGLGIVCAVLIAGALLGVNLVWLLAVAVLAALSFADDSFHLPFWSRLIIHLGVAVSVVILHGNMSIVWLVLLVLLITWSMNAYNFMDGADGLAGSMGVIGFFAYAFGFVLNGNLELAFFSASVAVCCTAFLWFNWPPAKIFMGDVGSIPLGFLAGLLGWFGVVGEAWLTWFPLMLFSPFVFDASITLTRRMLAKQKFWLPHRDHCYQRMISMAGGHRNTVVAWVVLISCGAVLAQTLHVWSPSWGWPVTAFWYAMLGFMAYRVNVHWAKHRALAE